VVPLRVAADLEYLRRPTVGATLRLLVVTALFVVGLADVQATAQVTDQRPRQRAAEG